MKIKLDHLGIISFKGEDAFKFANSQFSNNYLNLDFLDYKQARFSVFCSVQGRVLASLIGFKYSENELLLIVSKDLIENLIKKLKIFLFRSKCQINNLTYNFDIFGYLNENILNNKLNIPWDLKIENNNYLINLYSANNFDRNLLIIPKNFDNLNDLNNKEKEENVNKWNYSEILSGIVTINSKTTEKFIPQMLNYESVGGIDFKKGCYPGQEIIARTQFRGEIKRRTFLINSNQKININDDIFCEKELIGSVIQSAKNPDNNKWSALICIPIKYQNKELICNKRIINLNQNKKNHHRLSNDI